jgi:hypothetical protein
VAVREIELKYRVEDLEALLVALKSLGIELSEPVFQDDQAYAPAGWQFGDSKLGVSFLRLRTVQDRHYFTLKQPAGSAQDCLEFETQVTDRWAALNRTGTSTSTSATSPRSTPCPFTRRRSDRTVYPVDVAGVIEAVLCPGKGSAMNRSEPVSWQYAAEHVSGVPRSQGQEAEEGAEVPSAVGQSNNWP